MPAKNKQVHGITLFALLAIIILISLFVVAGRDPVLLQIALAEEDNLITGAAVSSTTLDVFTISTDDTSGIIRWKNIDGTTVSLPIAGDGSATAGNSQTESVVLAANAKNDPDERIYLEGESCQGTTRLTDCTSAQFLAIQNKRAHIVKITSINTEKNEISIKDMTYDKESNDNAYTDAAATSFVIGELSIMLTINEAANQVTFTATGSGNNAEIELYDKATLHIINTNTAAQTFEGLKFSEYNDGALSPAKYIGQGGTAPLSIEIVYDDLYDNSIEVSSIIDILTKAQGSGWYEANNMFSFYTNKGTLILYDEKEKHKLTIRHVATTASASVKLKATAEDSEGWTLYSVDKEGDVGKASSFILDSSGFVHISYFDETNDALKYAYETADGWYVQTVDIENVGRSSDIALDSSENPHIVYTDTKNSKLKYAMYDGTTWKHWTIEAAGSAAILPSLALDADDAQYITYYDFIDDDLMLLFYDATSAAWKTETRDAEGDVGTEASIAIDANNNPHIVYFDNTYDFLKYVWYDGTAWQKTTLDASGKAGLFTTLTLDKKNYPTVWYYNQLQDKVQYLSYVGDNQWEQKTFSLDGFDIWQGDIVLDENGYVHFSYYDKDSKDLRYAIGEWE
jgi:hypothetical protein